jgi:hypothetical protein
MPQAIEPIEETGVPQFNDDDVQQHLLLIPFQTPPDSMGLYCICPTPPTLIPQGDALDSVCDAATLDAAGNAAKQTSQSLTGVPLPPPEIMCENIYNAFSSPTAGLLMCWQYLGSTTRSAAETHHLTTFLDDDEYRREDARIFNIPCEKKLIKDYLMDTSNPFAQTMAGRSHQLKYVCQRRRLNGPLK